MRQPVVFDMHVHDARIRGKQDIVYIGVGITLRPVTNRIAMDTAGVDYGCDGEFAKALGLLSGSRAYETHRGWP